MSTLGTSLDKVKIIKNKDIITVIETYVTQDYSGLGYDPSKKASISINTNTVIHNKANLQIAVKENDLIIKSLAGSMHKFSFNLVDAEGVKGDDILKFAQNLML